MQKNNLNIDLLKTILLQVKETIVVNNHLFPYPISPSDEQKITDFTVSTYNSFSYNAYPVYNKLNKLFHHFSIVESEYIADPIPDYLDSVPKAYIVFGLIKNFTQYEVDIKNEEVISSWSEEEEEDWPTFAERAKYYRELYYNMSLLDLAKSHKNRKDFDPSEMKEFLKNNKKFIKDENLDDFIEKMKEYQNPDDQSEE